ncbi:MAG: hypothetical protein KJP22_09770 [Acidimicrobiia bacterium]|nr:hypothetical protein [Acidimicrobiia bacterium]MBT8213926.1 hypothetical protein [Acidimicrobiia bacterium]
MTDARSHAELHHSCGLRDGNAIDVAVCPPIEKRAAELGIRRVVGAVVPNFSLAAQMIAQTDLLLTVPSVAMANTAAAFHLDLREIPFDLPDMGLSLFRNEAEGDEPGAR